MDFLLMKVNFLQKEQLEKSLEHYLCMLSIGLFVLLHHAFGAELALS